VESIGQREGKTRFQGSLPRNPGDQEEDKEKLGGEACGGGAPDSWGEENQRKAAGEPSKGWGNEKKAAPVSLVGPPAVGGWGGNQEIMEVNWVGKFLWVLPQGKPRLKSIANAQERHDPP